jgi:hypothetical protein
MTLNSNDENDAPQTKKTKAPSKSPEQDNLLALDTRGKRGTRSQKKAGVDSLLSLK